MKRPVDVIVPVYAGRAEVQRCLESVVGNVQQTPYRLVVINDASPEPELHAWLETFAQRHEQVLLLKNRENLGFVATVNRGMSLSADNDVVLLNSDTEVANDWLDRLVAAAGQGADIGTLTPFSNNATICSFPRFCMSNELPHGWSVAQLDRLFARVNSGVCIDIPTGVGFCQYIRRACLDETGLFDVERFGRGYGEENDFCRRAAALGWRNLLCGDVFVFHQGGVSFSHQQEARIARAQQVLQQLHPDYHDLVAAHIQDDPAQLHRIRVLMEMYRTSPRKVVLHLTHHLGGGTKKHIRELSDWLSSSMDSLVIRPVEGGGARLYFGADDEAPSIYFPLPVMYPQLMRLLRILGTGLIHFHHTLGLETSLWGLADDLDLPCDITLHDYYFINAHPSQTDARGRYTDDLQAQQSSYPLEVSLEEWQANQRRLLDRADRILAPSARVVKEFEGHYPGLNYQVVYHPDSEARMPWPAVRTRYDGQRSLRILVLGALSPEKGADILEAAARQAKARNLPLEFHLLGYAYRPLDEAVIEHGAYREEDLPDLLQTLDADLIWFTALWPETYSYTLSEAFLSGLPIVVPDIGAFEERVRGRPLTWVRDWRQDAGQWLAQFSQIAGELAEASRDEHVWSDQPMTSPADFYREHYLKEVALPGVERLPEVETDWLLGVIKQSRQGERSSGALGRRERLLIHLLELRRGRIGRLVSRVVPVNLQRRIKRKLSRKPIHELRRD